MEPVTVTEDSQYYYQDLMGEGEMDHSHELIVPPIINDAIQAQPSAPNTQAEYLDERLQFPKFKYSGVMSEESAPSCCDAMRMEKWGLIGDIGFWIVFVTSLLMMTLIQNGWVYIMGGMCTGLWCISLWSVCFSYFKLFAKTVGNVRPASELKQMMTQHKQTPMKIIFHSESYGSEGSTRYTRIVDQELYYDGWMDVTVDEIPDLSGMKLVRINFEAKPIWMDEDSQNKFDKQLEEFKQQNVWYESNVHSVLFHIPGMEESVIFEGTPGCKPWWMSRVMYYVSVLFCVSSFYRILVHRSLDIKRIWIVKMLYLKPTVDHVLLVNPQGQTVVATVVHQQ